MGRREMCRRRVATERCRRWWVNSYVYPYLTYSRWGYRRGLTAPMSRRDPASSLHVILSIVDACWTPTHIFQFTLNLFHAMFISFFLRSQGYDDHDG
ncbi:MAG: hypothetical protein FE78DRAFT_501934 [Acidomyces sp. 'richmondensis']|nr:MAG: hypothetical protein FE78DRAFT_501934 [Acidomyces sp. 'richmondensis']